MTMTATQSNPVFDFRRDDANHDGPASSALYRAQPPSPTLTNPDMILPDYDRAQGLDDSPQSPPSMWNASRSNADFHFFPTDSLQSVPPGLTTPIIYGNGTMLSDIGEVTEVESTAGSTSLPRRSSCPLSETGSDGTPLVSSPTVGKKLVKKRATRPAARRERRLSLESTSTVNEPDRVPAPAPAVPAVGAATSSASAFDVDSLSVDDSNFQGDDEESMASSYIDEVSLYEAGATPTLPGQGLNQARFSTSFISKRAEQILANAKRRLNTMEGNLSRARNFSYSSASDSSTTPYPGAPPPTIVREMALPLSPAHSRNVSETVLQGPAWPTAQLQRSASALGVAGGYRQPLPLSRSVDAIGSRPSPWATKSPHHALDMTLATLSEDGDEVPVLDGKLNGSQAGSVVSPTASSYSDAGSARSASAAAQVRDLQDQMQGLKGKISSLKEQARADSLKRRSLRSLRTPSPFTHARWDQGYVESRSITTSDLGSPVLASPPGRAATGPTGKEEAGERPGSRAGEAQVRPEQVQPDEDAHSVGSGYPEGRETQNDDAHLGAEASEEPDAQDEGARGVHLNGQDGQDEPQTERGDVDDREEGVASNGDVASESGDSLYHDTYQHPISHEDREDAFDYEHFFLHSAMGTMSRQGMSRRESSGSEESSDSVETTRGPSMSRPRRPSLDTFTTIDSFATATEGRTSRNSVIGPGREEEDEEDGGSVTPSRGYYDGLAEAGERSTFGATSVGSSSGDETGRAEPGRRRQDSVLYRPIKTGATSSLHRPSISSFESTGTNRSFPLVNKVRMSGGMLTPVGSPEHDLKQVSESLMMETASTCDKESVNGGPQSPPMQTLSREDQLLVERVVAGLGKCVLGLTEASRASPGGQAEFRRRIDAARRILEAGQ